jgi:hypothetical protein
MTSEANGYQPGGGAEWRGPSPLKLSPTPRLPPVPRLRRTGRRTSRRGKPVFARASTRQAGPWAGGARDGGQGFHHGLPGWARICGAGESVLSAIRGQEGAMKGTKRTKGTRGTVAGRAGVLVMAVCSKLHPVAVSCTKKIKSPRGIASPGKICRVADQMGNENPTESKLVGLNPSESNHPHHPRAFADQT